MTTGNFYDGMLGIIESDGERFELMGGLNFIGVTVERDTVANRLNITFVGEQGVQGEQGPPGADGVMNAPEDGAEDFCVPYADGGDLTYDASFKYSAAGGLVVERGSTPQSPSPGIHLVSGGSATELNPAIVSPTLRFSVKVWDESEQVRPVWIAANASTNGDWWLGVSLEASADSYPGLGLGAGFYMAGTNTLVGAWSAETGSGIRLIRANGGLVELDPDGAGVTIGGAFACNGVTPPPARAEITGSTGSVGLSAVVAQLLAALDALGLITDSTTE